MWIAPVLLPSVCSDDASPTRTVDGRAPTGPRPARWTLRLPSGASRKRVLDNSSRAARDELATTASSWIETADLQRARFPAKVSEA
jgi:hypothetical protein